MRKEAGFEVTDRICVYYEASENAARVLTERADSLCGAVLASSVSVGTTTGYTKQWDINGESVTLTVKKV